MSSDLSFNSSWMIELLFLPADCEDDVSRLTKDTTADPTLLAAMYTCESTLSPLLFAVVDDVTSNCKHATLVIGDLAPLIALIRVMLDDVAKSKSFTLPPTSPQAITDPLTIQMHVTRSPTKFSCLVLPTFSWLCEQPVILTDLFEQPRRGGPRSLPFICWNNPGETAVI